MCIQLLIAEWAESEYWPDFDIVILKAYHLPQYFVRNSCQPIAPQEREDVTNGKKEKQEDLPAVHRGDRYTGMEREVKNSW